MSERWSTEEVRALAPDTSSHKAAVKVAKPASWPALAAHGSEDGAGPDGVGVLWGECAGSGRTPYRAAVHLAGPDTPAYRCSCPSRKIPCKHVLGLLLLWAEGRVERSAEEEPGWVSEWLSRRRGAATRRASTSAPDPEAAARRAQRRETRVAEGLAELEMWLRDQVENGLAGARGTAYGHWDGMAARLVDAQAGRVAERVRALSRVASATDWPGLLLEEYAQLRLLATAYRRREELPEPMRATVRARAGLTTAPDGTDRVRDSWWVLGRYDFQADQVRGRRFWLRGCTTGRTAILLSFAAQGRSPDSPVRLGHLVDAELDFYPAEWRATLAERHTERQVDPPPGGTVDDALADWARALAGDPWLEAWPVVLTDAVLGRHNGWWLADPSGSALPLHEDADPWRLAAVTGGHPATVAGEWTPQGLRPLTVWDPDHRPVPVEEP